MEPSADLVTDGNRDSLANRPASAASPHQAPPGSDSRPSDDITHEGPQAGAAQGLKSNPQEEARQGPTPESAADSALGITADPVGGPPPNDARVPILQGQQDSPHRAEDGGPVLPPQQAFSDHAQQATLADATPATELPKLTGQEASPDPRQDSIAGSEGGSALRPGDNVGPGPSQEISENTGKNAPSNRERVGDVDHAPSNPDQPGSDSSGSLLVGGDTINLVEPTPAPSPSVLTIAGESFIANPAGFAIQSTNLIPGGPAVTVSRTPISLAPSGSLLVGNSVLDIAQPTPGGISLIFTVAGQGFTANPSGFALSSASLSAGGSGLILSGTPISLGPSGAMVIGNSIIPLAARGTAPGTSSIFTLGGETFTASPSGFSVQGTTLEPGGAGVSIAGTPISLAPLGTLVIGNSSIAFISTGTPPSPFPVFTISDATFTANPSGFGINGTALQPGGPGVTVANTPISLASGGSIVVGSSTFGLSGESGGSPTIGAVTGANGGKNAELGHEGGNESGNNAGKDMWSLDIASLGLLFSAMNRWILLV